jgi:hypothetical protein
MSITTYMKRLFIHPAQVYTLCIAVTVISDMTLLFATAANAGPPPENPSVSNGEAAPAVDIGGGEAHIQIKTSKFIGSASN